MYTSPSQCTPSDELCCTCATPLSLIPRTALGEEKPLPNERRLPCCDRIVCGNCIYTNTRFASYCPYCQTSASPALSPRHNQSSHASSLAPPPAPPPYPDESQPPPAYDQPPSPHDEDDDPPHSREFSQKAAEAPKQPQDVLHFLNHETDTLTSLSLLYDIPPQTLRAANNLTSDHLLAARRTLLIPASHNSSGRNFAPRPPEGEEEVLRKNKIRRFMVSCKVAEYEVAEVYLQQAGYDFESAVEAFWGDEAWERENPYQREAGSGRRGRVRTGERMSLWRRVASGGARS